MICYAYYVLYALVLSRIRYTVVFTLNNLTIIYNLGLFMLKFS